MFDLSPRFFLSPRFYALPVIAVAVIVALAQAHSGKSIGTEVAGPTVYRAGNCATPAKAGSAACTIARDNAIAVR
jgi:hypothetical protein